VATRTLLLKLRKALEMAGLTAKDLDLIIIGTITPDTCCPSAANWLQAKLDAPQAVTFDVTAACSGLSSVSMWRLSISSPGFQKQCSCGCGSHDQDLNWKDRHLHLVGDGAGAAILTKDSGGHQILSSHMHTDGKNGQDLLMPEAVREPRRFRTKAWTRGFTR